MKLKYLKCNYLFIVVVSLTVLIYFPGLKGGFLFDDYPNLANLSQISNFGEFKSFVLNGGAGPSGRPISLFTFALQAQSWPKDPFLFKLVNLIIHVICGILLYWATILLLKSYGIAEKKIKPIALLSTTIWLLHPFFVSTTLYVIQRMTQLPVLFSLLGIIGYLIGRDLLKTKKYQAYSLMAISIGLATILATFSKENGALLPLLIFIIEFCNPNKMNKPVIWWRVIFLWIPSFAIFFLLFRYIDFSTNPWPNRNFNQIERLLTESRIVVDYLINLFIPRIEGHGLYQDGYVVSKSLFDPISTLYCIALLLSLLISAFYFKNRFPLFGLAILFFLASQLMESTFIGLELYFEHRNYLSALFIFLPVSSLFINRFENNKKTIYVVILSLIFILAFMLHERVKLWSDTQRLQVFWAQNNPQSNRAQVNYANILWNAGRKVESTQLLENSIRLNPSATLYIQLLKQKINLNIADEHDFSLTRKVLLRSKIDGEVIWQIRWLVDTVVNDPALSQNYGRNILVLLSQLSELNKSYDPNFPALIALLNAQLYASVHDERNAYLNYRNAIFLYNDVNSSLAVITDCANRGYKKASLELLNEVEKYYFTSLNNETGLKKIFIKLKASILSDVKKDKVE